MDDKVELEEYRGKVLRELSSRRIRLEQLTREITEITFQERNPFAGKRCFRGAEILAFGKQSLRLQARLKELVHEQSQAQDDVRRAEERLAIANDELKALQKTQASEFDDSESGMLEGDDDHKEAL